MIDQPVFEKDEGFEPDAATLVAEIFIDVSDLFNQLLVSFYVVVVFGITLFTHHAFFKTEVAFGVIDELIENLLHYLLSLAVFEGVMQIIGKCDQFAVLFVDLRNPGQQRFGPFERV